ncbi:MAG: C10 family peptidase [Bacteroides sp.]|nr:C10 family peptidase [Bacteroides sp.]
MKYLLLFLCCLLSSILLADNVPVEQAQALAVKFFQTSTQTRNASPALQLVWNGEEDEVTSRTSTTAPAFYVFNRTDTDGFIIIAGDDIAMPVLGYSFEHSFRTEKMPVNLKGWLKGIRTQINKARANQATTSSSTAQAWKAVNGNEVGNVEISLETADWNQDSPYNDQCPTINGERAVTGCVATAIAIVMRYHQWPEQGEGTLPSYQYTSEGQTINIEAVELGHTYDWSNMPLQYNSYSSSEAKQQVATLMRDCGTMVEASYGTSSTGAYTYKVAPALVTYMKYDKSIQYLSREWYSDDEWHQILKQEMATNGPILYNGYNAEAGHQFVLDGCTSLNYFSVNWGWSGSCNGYYLLSALNPSQQGIGGSSDGYNIDQGAVIGLKKTTDNSTYEDILVLARATKGGTGLYTTEENFQTNKSFTLQASYVFNYGIRTFNGEVIATLFDKHGNVKEDISDAITVNSLNPRYGRILNITCTITKNIKGGDYIRLRYKSGDGSEWKIVRNSDDVTGEILLKEEILSPDSATSFTYNRTDKIILLETLSNMGYSLQSGSDGSTVVEGTADEDGLISIDVSNLSAGSYILILTGEEESKTIRLKIGSNQ